MPNPTHALFVVDVVHDGRRTLHGPVRNDVAERFAAGVRAAGVGCEVLQLTLADPDFCIAGAGVWPPRGFRIDEVASIYVEPHERFVVSFIQGYDHDSDVTSAEQAVEAAVLDTHLQRPTWFVFDRHTGALTPISQPTDADPATVAPRDQVALSGRALAAVSRIVDLETDLDPESRVLDPRTWHANGYGDHDAYERHIEDLQRARRRMQQSPTAGAASHGDDATPATTTPNGYDERWVAAINEVLAARGSTLRAVDLDDSIWERFVDPLVDAFEDGQVAGNLAVDGFDEGAEGEHAARELSEGPDFDDLGEPQSAAAMAEQVEQPCRTDGAVAQD